MCTKKIKLNPVEKYKEYKKEKECIKQNDLETRQLNVMMENIDNYDGTSTGQQDIPIE